MERTMTDQKIFIAGFSPIKNQKKQVLNASLPRLMQRILNGLLLKLTLSFWKSMSMLRMQLIKYLFVKTRQMFPPALLAAFGIRYFFMNTTGLKISAIL
jgi:hypothetical protein